MTITKKELDSALDQQTEKLVEFLQDQFKEIDDRFDGVDNRLDGVDQRLDGVEGRLRVVETKLDHALYVESVHVEARLRRLEKHAGLKSLAPALETPPPRK